MNIKSRVLSAIIALLFSVGAIYSGSALAAHCEHEPQPSEDILPDYDNMN